MFRKGFGIKLLNLISMGPFSLGRPKWEGALGPKEAQGGRRPRGSFLEASPPPWRSPWGGETLGRSPRAAPLSKLAPLPFTLYIVEVGAPLETQF